MLNKENKKDNNIKIFNNGQQRKVEIERRRSIRTIIARLLLFFFLN
jgi:hypothetical protein